MTLTTAKSQTTISSWECVGIKIMNIPPTMEYALLLRMTWICKNECYGFFPCLSRITKTKQKDFPLQWKFLRQECIGMNNCSCYLFWGRRMIKMLFLMRTEIQINDWMLHFFIYRRWGKKYGVVNVDPQGLSDKCLNLEGTKVKQRMTRMVYNSSFRNDVCVVSHWMFCHTK